MRFDGLVLAESGWSGLLPHWVFKLGSLNMRVQRSYLQIIGVGTRLSDPRHTNFPHHGSAADGVKHIAEPPKNGRALLDRNETSQSSIRKNTSTASRGAIASNISLCDNSING